MNWLSFLIVGFILSVDVVSLEVAMKTGEYFCIAYQMLYKLSLDVVSVDVAVEKF